MVALSVVVTVQSGFDLEYYLAQAATEPERSPGAYYINASIRGEAAGRWFGTGTAASRAIRRGEPARVPAGVQPGRPANRRASWAVGVGNSPRASATGSRSSGQQSHTPLRTGCVSSSSRPGAIPGRARRTQT